MVRLEVAFSMSFVSLIFRGDDINVVKTSFRYGRGKKYFFW